MKISSFSQFAMARARRCRPAAAARAAGLAAGLALTLAASSADAQVRTRYERVLAQVEALRLDGPRPSPLSHMRRTVSACEAVADRYPASGYADNALWQAATVALAAFRVYGSDVDREDAERLLSRLVRGYPSSSLRQKATTLLRTAQAPAKRIPTPTRQARVDPPAPPVTPAAATRTVEESPATRVSPAPAVARPAPQALLRKVTRHTFNDFVRVIVELDAEVAFRREEITGPARLYFDFEDTQAAADLQDSVLRFEGPAGRQIRLGRPRASTTRLVVDLDGTESYSVFTLYSPYRLAIDLRHRPLAPPPIVARHAPSPVGQMAPAVASRAVANDLLTPERIVPRPLPHPLARRPVATVTPVAARRVAPVMAPPPLTARALRISPRMKLLRAPESGPTARRIEERLAQDLARKKPPLAASQPIALVAPPPAAVPSAPAQNGAGGYSLARQLGLGVSRIVIDPGHGGHDPGVPGGRHTTESEVVLDVALRLEKLLAREPGVDVVMTRRTDVFVPLEQRTAMANRAGADLFLSIHANSSRNKQASGVETYFLNFANNPEAEAVAARENATAAQSMHQLTDMVRAITLNNKLDESRDFAQRVQSTLVSRLGVHNDQLRDRGVKQAPFVVLIGAGMPSVLAEIAFLSHQGENDLLRTERYRQRVAEALFEAVVTYQRSLKGLGTMASSQQ
jgi:N-acetylmuramoyl-L-alanine amidase